MIRRKQHVDALLKRLRAFPVVAIPGPRQIGKTTLAHQVGQAHTGPKVTPSIRSALRDLGLAEVIIVHAAREPYPLGANVRAMAAARMDKDLGL